jgi:hypothetical protein
MKLAPPFRIRPRGFALVISLSLMVLLTILAVGLLGVSTISLRGTGHTEALAIAKANARMALMLALGDLQKHAGPDQRITARADIRDEKIANPRLTGVWKSWEIKPDSPPSPSDYEKSSRDKKFLGWLASSGEGKDRADVEFASRPAKEPATLWGKGSLGKAATGADIVTASRVDIASSKGSSRDGAFAWAVMDEGVKVRINTPYVDTAASKAMQTAQLGSGVRPNVSSISVLEELKRE